MAYLALVRHGESEWNKKGLWAGLTDVELTEKGRSEAREAGENLKDIKFDYAFVSVLARAKETLGEITDTLGYKPQTIENDALNERNYGDFTGKNKWEIEKEVGREMFSKIRRSWDYPIQNGESLKDVYERVLPYYRQIILPLLKEGKNIIISAHGNSLRALVKYLDNISDEDISKLELATGGIYIYKIDENGNVVSKELRGPRENRY